MKDENGLPLADPDSVAERWRQHFASKLAGIVCTTEALQIAAWSRASARSVNGVVKTVSVDDLPSYADIVSQFRRLSDGKGHGSDSLPPELFKSAAQQVAAHVHPLVLKCLARVAEPIRWKGTTLTQLFKGKGDYAVCSNFRGICVSDLAAKVYHSWLRRRSMPMLESIIPDSFFGGFRRRGTDMALLMSREIWVLAHSRSQSVAQIFLDIISAFDALVRQVILGMDVGPGGLDDQQVAFLLKTFGFEAEEIRRIVGIIPEVSFLQSSGVSQCISDAIKEAHQDTWYHVQGSTLCTLTRSGSKAGDPLGDLLFNYLMVRTRTQINDELHEQGLLPDLPDLPGEFDGIVPPVVGTTKLIGSTYVDDDAVPILSESADELVPKIREVMSVIARVYRLHGLPLNFKADKTEALLKFRGPGAAAQQHRMAILADGVLHFPAGTVAADTPEFSLRVVRSYMHMGSVVGPDLKLLPEVRHRAGCMYAAHGKLRRRVLHSPRIDLEVKTRLVTTLLHTRLCHNAGTWPCMTDAEFASFAHAYVAPLRTAASMENHAHTHRHTDAQVLVQTSAPTPRQGIMRLRLAMFTRMAIHAPPLLAHLLYALCDEKRSWIYAALSDLHLLWRRFPDDLRALPSPELAPWEWVAAVRESPRPFRALLMRLVRRCHSSGAGATDVDERMAEHCCDKCPRVFRTKDALLSHAARLHGYRNPVASRVTGSVCAICGTQFWTTSRLYKHVANRSKRCAAGYLDSLPELSPEEREERRVCIPKALENKALHRPAVRAVPSVVHTSDA